MVRLRYNRNTINTVFFFIKTVEQEPGKYLLNNMDLDSDLMRYDKNNVVTGQKTIENVRTDVLQVDKNINVQDVDILGWLENAVLNDGTFDIQGKKRFNGTVTFAKGIR